MRDGKPQFAIRANDQLSTVTSAESIVGQWTHVVGLLTGSGQLQLYVNGKLAAAAQENQFFVQHQWTADIPLLVYAMLKADSTLFIAGPPDVLDEEESFQALTRRSASVQAKLAEQDAALAGEQGGLLCAVGASATHIVTGDRRHLLPLGSFEGIPIVTPTEFLAMAPDS